MAHLILDLERYQAEVLERRPHPLLGPASINVGVIEGGVSANVVADACTIRVDRRMVPGEDPQAVIAELQADRRQRARPPIRNAATASTIFWSATGFRPTPTGDLLRRFLRDQRG